MLTTPFPGTLSGRPAQVDLAAVAKALKSGHLRGAAVDVYPSEPKGNGPGFQTVLAGCPNVIMTPHIGTPRRLVPRTACLGPTGSPGCRHCSMCCRRFHGGGPACDRRGGRQRYYQVSCSPGWRQGRRLKLCAHAAPVRRAHTGLLSRYINVGSTVGSVNFPEVDLRTPDPKARTVRILNIHENVPGVLKVHIPRPSAPSPSLVLTPL